MTTTHVTQDELETRAFDTGALIVNRYDLGHAVLIDGGRRYVAPLGEVAAK